MSIGAISGIGDVAAIQPVAPTAPIEDQAPKSLELAKTSAPAPELIAGTIPPLSSSVLATLLGEQRTLYGSFY